MPLQQTMTMGDFTQAARDLAHSLNNLMAVILANGEMALLRLNPADPLHGHVTKMSQAAQRATALASDLVRSKRIPGSEPMAASLDASVKGALSFFPTVTSNGPSMSTR